MTMKVKSDKYLGYEKERKARLEAFGITSASDCEPVDMYGKRVNLDQNDASNLSKTADDIQDHYGLEPSPNEPDNGGLAEKDDESSDY